MEQDRDEVRIMTVHGAKGLQAPIVFLPDTCMLPRAQGPRLFPVPRLGAPPDEVTHLVWSPGRSDLEAIAEAKAAVRRAEIEESHRLLYVAMTRARDRLYVCGWKGQREPEKDCWYHLVRDALDGYLSPVETEDGTTARRMVSAQEKPVEKKETQAETSESPPLPDWALTLAKPERVRTRLAPSRLALNVEGGPEGAREQPPLGPKALAENMRFARGRLVHALLQHLPEVAAGDQERAARVFVAARGAGLGDALKEEIVAETLAIVRNARLRAAVSAGQPRRGAGGGADRRRGGRFRARRADRPSRRPGRRPPDPRLQDEPAAALNRGGGGASLYRSARRLPARACQALPGAAFAGGAVVDRRAAPHGDFFNFA